MPGVLSRLLQVRRVMRQRPFGCFVICFLSDTATTEVYTLSLHDALPICAGRRADTGWARARGWSGTCSRRRSRRSEEHTSELQSRQYLVCRLLLEKKKNLTQV